MNGHCNGFPWAGSRRDLERLDIYATHTGGLVDHTFAADQNRHDRPLFRCGHYTGKRFGIGRIDDCCCDRGKTPRLDSTHDIAETHLFVVETNCGKKTFGRRTFSVGAMTSAVPETTTS